MPTCKQVINWPKKGKRTDIEPVFLPFRGCPVKCVFCAQQTQTGQRPGQDLAGILAAAEKRLQARVAGGRAAPELAFYGGTFTALPDSELQTCLDFASECRRRGLVGSVRCSTRPDCVSPLLLGRLTAAGCATVELGVQSFATSALQEARRGYDGAMAAAACAMVRQAGLRLGVQLLPGMPGVTPAVFLDDVARAMDLGADMLRFYPCLVLAGTGLAAMWERGDFVPWDLATTVDALTGGWLQTHRAGVPVIRMGLAPEAGLEQAILAGPVHPALGDMVRGRGVLHLVREAMAASGCATLESLDVPRHCQGYFWGQRGELAPEWSQLGLHKGNVRFVA